MKEETERRRSRKIALPSSGSDWTAVDRRAAARPRHLEQGTARTLARAGVKGASSLQREVVQMRSEVSVSILSSVSQPVLSYSEARLAEREQTPPSSRATPLLEMMNDRRTCPPSFPARDHPADEQPHPESWNESEILPIILLAPAVDVAESKACSWLGMNSLPLHPRRLSQ